VGLTSLLFFSVTGITLNHPDWFSAQRSEQFTETVLEPAWLVQFEALDELTRLDYLARELDVRWQLGVPRNIDRDEFEWVLDYQRPGGFATVVLTLETGELVLEQVNNGPVAIMNDLHKGRHAGPVWFYLIDVAAVVCLLFAITGVLLLYVHAGKRRSTWPLVGLGTFVPFMLYWYLVP
jgi:hypothetical protein